MTQIKLPPTNPGRFKARGVWSPAGGYRASQMPKTSKTLKLKVDKTVDTFHPLTVNRLLGRLVNTLDSKVIGAVARR